MLKQTICLDIGENISRPSQGQWIFGGIEQESRKCFMVAVDKRDQATLLLLIEKWIEPGTVIISDCCKAYCNLEKHGYAH